MRTTMDRAGRLVLPKGLREQVGLVAGEVEVSVVGASLVIEPAEHAALDEQDGRLYLPRSGEPVTSDEIRDLRLADQR